LKQFTLLLIALAVLGISILVPTLIDVCAWDRVSRSRDIVTALSAFITLVIALLLYDRFGIGKSLLEKQNNSVISLLEAMKRLRLVLHGRDGIFLFTVSRKKFDYFESQSLGGKALLFNYRYLEEMKDISNAAENLLLPPQIREAFQPLIYHTFNTVRPDQTLPDEYLLIDPVTIDEKEIYGKFNNQQTTLSEYLSSWRTIIQVSTQWLRDHSSIQIELNI
jgi:hypothetical protein